MIRPLTIASVGFSACILAFLQATPAFAAVLPADEAWTESTSVSGQFGWGNYEGTQTSITTDATDKTAGDVSIKFTGVHNASGPLGPALIFLGGNNIDVTPYAGGTFGFDLKLGNVTNFKYVQLVMMSGGVQGNQVSQNLSDLELGWNHVEVPVAATGPGFVAAGWSSGNPANFDPSDIHQIRFRFIYQTPGGVYDSATPRDLHFDNIGFVIPEPASGGLLLGAIALGLMKGRRS